MKDGENHEDLIPPSEIDSVWKPAQYGASDILKGNLVSFGMSCRAIDRLGKLVQELLTETALPLFVPSSRLFQFILCGSPKYNLQSHRPSRARTEAFTSFQGMTSFG